MYNQIDYSSLTRNKNRPSLMHDPMEEQKHHQIIDLPQQEWK